MKKRLKVGLLKPIGLLMISQLLFSPIFAQPIFQKKIIQFGWDYPTISFLEKHLPEMEKQPFEGVAFSFDFKIFDLFDTIVYPEKLFQFDALKSLKWGTFTDNFIRVRAQSKNGPLWLSDKSWNNMEKNLRNISKAVALSGAKGIFFDPEYYYGDTLKSSWVYNGTLYPDMSYEEVGAIVRKRGSQFINAISYYKNDMNIFCLWLLSLVYLQSKSKPASQTVMGLYPFFVEGMLQSKKPQTKITDGNELGYYYKYSNQFIESGMQLRAWGMQFMPPLLKPKYEDISIGQPIFYDGLFGTFPRFENGLNDSQKKNWLWENLYNAMKTTDKYVWFYNSKINWWNGTIDPVLPGIIRQVKTRVQNEYLSKKEFKGTSFLYDFLKGTIDQFDFFSYDYNPKTKFLSVSFNKKDIQTFRIFENSRLLYETKNPTQNLQITLKNYSGGNIILIASAVGDKNSVAFVN